MLKQRSEIIDQDVRDHALNPHESFIVQAPAGSGKTQLLITRFLILLLYVERPEEILALTFTRKAAAEMKRRIVETLHQFKHTTFTASAQSALPQDGDLQTLNIEKIAHAVLQRDSLKGWNILKNLSRLRIMTLDSFCAKLVRQLPLHSELYDIPNICENPLVYYDKAIDALLAEVEQNSTLSDTLQSLLEHYDYSWNKVKHFLIHLLQTREQWLSYLNQLSTDNFAGILQQNLEVIVNSHLIQIKHYIDVSLQEEWLALVQFSVQQLQNMQNVPVTEVNYFPKADAAFLTLWKQFIHCVLTKEGTLRRQVDKRLGFPAAASACNSTEKVLFKEMKVRMQTFLQQLAEIDGVEECLGQIMTLPNVEFSEFQHVALSNLLVLLPALAQQLKKIFLEHSTADFTTIQRAATMSLGSADEPSDLLLELDERINHILIDEFQDTSNVQYHLLQTLTAGWQCSDGRTLFLVGDPQQSIYGFRAAEVGLFLKAQRDGIGDVKLTPLFLKMNFRSAPTLIHWYNKIFQTLFPKHNDEVSGAVQFSHAHAMTQNENPLSHVSVHVYEKDSVEHKQLYLEDIVQFIQKNNETHPDERIAILVRNRKHALPVLEALHAANIACNATGIKRLVESAAILDLLALMRAFLSLNDRIAWLSVLRAPWCGLTLSDLLILCENKQKCILELLQSDEIVTQLSSDAQQRLHFFLPIVLNFIKKAGYQPLHEWFESLWLALLGPATLNNQDQFFEVHTFFKLLTQFCQQEPALFHYQKFFEFLQNEDINECHSHDHSVEIMTIHKAKGLEFDHVILLGLERLQKSNTNSLLLWHEFVTPMQQESCLFLLAPLYLSDNHDKHLYQFIRQQKKYKQEHEELRLFYVAVTRAKCQLHIFMQLNLNEEKSIHGSHSLLTKKLWPLIQENIYFPVTTEKLLNPKNTLIASHHLMRFSAYPQQQEHPDLNNTAFNIEARPLADHFSIQRHINLETITGTIIHEILCSISKIGLASYLKSPSNPNDQRWKIRLCELGATPQQVPLVMQRIEETLTALHRDAHATWLLDPTHQQAQSEWPLYFTENDDSKFVIVDRTFIADRTRWIVDYKTDAFTTQFDSLADFLNAKKQEHHSQLQNYARIIEKFDRESLQQSNPIKLALYFPCIPAWIEWDV